MIIDHRRKILFCAIGKNGCTTWKTLMANNTGIGPNLTSNFNPKSYIHHNLDLFGIVQQRRLTKDLYERIENYTKFLVLRHPFDRLLSAYFDKAVNHIHPFLNRTYGLYNKIRDFALRNFPHNYSSEFEKENYLPSFKEFVNYVRRNQQNGHWLSQSSQCNICAVHYDYIMRIETMPHDCPLFTKKYYPEVQHCPNHNSYRATYSSKELFSPKILNAFNELTGKEMKFIQKLYQQDLQRFGYHFDVKTKKASCLIEQSNCC